MVDRELSGGASQKAGGTARIGPGLTGVRLRTAHRICEIFFDKNA